MGTDNLFHKRKARKNQRKTAYRQEYDKVLIVCEGEKTEPYYFKELINHYKISSANVKVDGSCGSSPKCVLEFAQRLYREEKNKGDAYNRVYCVIDRDTHASYDETITKIQNKESFLQPVLLLVLSIGYYYILKIQQSLIPTKEIQTLPMKY